MPRIGAVCLTVLLLLGAASARAFEVFQDPQNMAVNPGVPLEFSGTMDLNLFIHQDGVAADPSVACSGTPQAGAEFCGWDLHIVSSGGITLDDFVPEPVICAGGSNDGLACLVAADCPGGSCPDIVHNCELGCGGEFRANGGDPLRGQVGTRRIGTLTVTAPGGAVGSVDVVGNLYVTSILQTATIPSNPLALAGDPCLGQGGDFDNDGFCDLDDNCPVTFQNDQTDGDGDGVGDACDNCMQVFNQRVASPAAWMTLSGGQRDDDGDGFGNICDGKFTTAGAVVGPPDIIQFIASLGKNRTTSLCGSSGNENCARYDLDEGNASLIGPPDIQVLIGLLGVAPGPKCDSCPLL